MKLLKNTNDTRIIEYLLVISILFIFEIAFMERFEYQMPISYFALTIASISLIPAIVLLFKSSKVRFVLNCLYLLISLVLFVGNSCLFFYKKDIFSLGMLTDIGDGMNMGIVYNIFIAFELWEWILIFGYITFVVICLFKLNYVLKYRFLKPKFGHALIILFSFFILSFPNIFIKKTDEPIYTSPQDKRTYLYTFGISSYSQKDMTSFINNVITKGTRKIQARDILDNIETEMSDESPLFGRFADTNIIMIMTETVEEYAIDEKLTPTLYELYYGKYTFTNAYGVAKSNSTYDAEFKSLTSMMYFNSDNLMHSYADNEYMNALPNVLRKNGYTTASFHSFKGEFFNRINMHPAMGFDKSYFEEDMVFSETDLWALDSGMFMQMKDKIAPIQDDPFMSFILTLTAHGTHDDIRTELNPYYQLIEEDCRPNGFR